MRPILGPVVIRTWLLCLALCIVVAVSARATEVLLYDGTFTTTAAEHGFRYFGPSPAAGLDWLTPRDLYEGQ